MNSLKYLSILIALWCCVTFSNAVEEDGRSLGFLRPFGGGGQTIHYESFGGNGGGLFGKYPGYGYESYTSTGGGYGKPFFGHGFGKGYGNGFGYGYGGGYGGGFGFYPGYGYPHYPYPGLGYGFGPGFGYFK